MGTQIVATMDNLKFSCFTLRKLNNRIKEREVRSQRRLNSSYDSFCILNQRNNTTRELLDFLQPPSDKPRHRNTDRSREQVERRRDQLMDDISSFTENFST